MLAGEKSGIYLQSLHPLKFSDLAYGTESFCNTIGTMFEINFGLV